MAILKYFSLSLFCISLFSCVKQKGPAPELSHIVAEAEVYRFDKRFYESSAENLPQLKEEFPYLFPESNKDSVWISKMKDEDELFLYNSTQEVFGDFTEEKQVAWRRARW